MEWYYADASDKQISVDESALSGLVADGTIKPETLVWNESMSDWLPCRQVKPELFASPSQATTRTVATATDHSLAQSPAARPAYQPPVRQPGPADGPATTSMVCGIVGLVLSFGCVVLPLIPSIIAIVSGNKAKRITEEMGLPANGQATAGLITGYIGLGFGILGLLVMIAYFVFFFVMVGTAAVSDLPSD